jgi:trans-2,3-dihydro-3-hydroxyanthranilate isomerase
MRLRLVWVDVFTDRPFAGNPLAVAPDADEVPPERMQELAAELGLSETVFALRPASPGTEGRLRIFTPAHELPMAGHPVVGAAWVLRREGRIGAEARLETGVGPLRVRADDRGAAMEQLPPSAGPLIDGDDIARACGVTASPSPRARVWSTGLSQAMVPVGSVAELERAHPHGPTLMRIGARDGWVGVSLYALASAPGAPVIVRVRHFAPGEGVLEDPATGSAAGALGACLADAGLGQDGALRVTVRQGVEMGRPGEVAVRVEGRDGRPARVEVAGGVAAVLEARLLVPAPPMPATASSRAIASRPVPDGSAIP